MSMLSTNTLNDNIALYLSLSSNGSEPDFPEVLFPRWQLIKIDVTGNKSILLWGNDTKDSAKNEPQSTNEIF